MINNDRIVPVTKMDLLSLMGTAIVFSQMASNFNQITNLDADEIGVFSASANGQYYCTEPAKKIEIGSAVTQAAFVFVPAYDYDGIYIDGTKVTPAEGSAEVDAEPNAFYGVMCENSEVYVSKMQIGEVD